MSRYTMKAQDVERNYVVIKHGIPNVNGYIMGVRFRNGWAVVEKDSKIYHSLKRLPMLRTGSEHPLVTLKTLPFITRTGDIKTIFGADVYAKYLDVERKGLVEKAAQDLIDAEAAHKADKSKCQHRSELTGKLCRNPVEDYTVSDHCSKHIFKDPAVEALNIKVPAIMTDKERKKMKKVVFNKIKKSEVANVSEIEDILSDIVDEAEESEEA